ncbi:type II toxin-antitoxin system RelE/ParE family toxin [Burkholderia diffusa]|uniref:type II toxin-antitoxin system RelE/ParE family toxin n=1 Tax=Burkholderia diffusa TaxID=488732 RepID=UPI003AF80800
MIDDWVKTLSKKARANFSRTRDHLRHQPPEQWDRPHASPLGNHIYVIRFRDENSTQHRAFGHFRSKNDAFVLTNSGIEKDNVYEPSTYRQSADDARGVCEQTGDDRSRCCFGSSAGTT